MDLLLFPKRPGIREIHDRPWCPALLRDTMTECLSLIWLSGMYIPALKLLGERLRSEGGTRIVDLCSGAGLFLPGFRKYLCKVIPSGVEIRKTDLYPDPAYFAHDTDHVKYIPRPLSAARALREEEGVFTMFSALHHFDPPELTEILRVAAEHQRTFFFFDICQRRIFSDILPCLFLPLVMWLLTPFIRPFSWKRLLFVYGIPVSPLLLMTDGFLSRMRAYTQPELEKVLADVRMDFPHFRFRTEVLPSFFGFQKITVLSGCPETAEETRSE